MASNGAYRVTAGDKVLEISRTADGGYALNGEVLDVASVSRRGDMISCKFGNKIYDIYLVKNDESSYEIWLNHLIIPVKIEDPLAQLLAKFTKRAHSEDKFEIRAPMPGLITSIRVKVGDTIKKETPVATLEAMKMENEIRSPIDGTIKKIEVEKGARVEKGQRLITIESK
ncbi:MAG TPA: acetyl-CoA carboxylase biotin carboxyl carrier protein subunit [Bacteroidota bacterium]|nr:acetyl-CoA carboxylase biotin carboxyl carrier protein subunit [Bacteroidota bacterium]